MATREEVLAELVRKFALRFGHRTRTSVAAATPSRGMSSQPGTDTPGGPQKAGSLPIIDASSYAIVLHEIGHLENPCVPTHRRIKRGEKPIDGELCVQCELGAWRWAQMNALDWTIDMHDELREGLGSYRRYGTPSEQQEIDTLTSDLDFCRVRLARAVR